MKKILLALLLVPALLMAQPPICAPAGCDFQWDAPVDMSGIIEYKFHVSQTSGDYDFNDPLVTVPVSTTEAAAGILAPGTWYAVVTSSDGTNQSGPSNEVSFTQPLGPEFTPGNLIIKISQLSDGTFFMEVERVACADCIGEIMTVNP